MCILKKRMLTALVTLPVTCQYDGIRNQISYFQSFQYWSKSDRDLFEDGIKYIAARLALFSVDKNCLCMHFFSFFLWHSAVSAYVFEIVLIERKRCECLREISRRKFYYGLQSKGENTSRHVSNNSCQLLTQMQKRN